MREGAIGLNWGRRPRHFGRNLGESAARNWSCTRYWPGRSIRRCRPGTGVVNRARWTYPHNDRIVGSRDRDSSRWCGCRNTECRANFGVCIEPERSIIIEHVCGDDGGDGRRLHVVRKLKPKRGRNSNSLSLITVDRTARRVRPMSRSAAPGRRSLLWSDRYRCSYIRTCPV